MEKSRDDDPDETEGRARRSKERTPRVISSQFLEQTMDAKVARKETREELLTQLSTERLRYNDEKMRWMTERAGLMRVIFQLSEALEYKKRH